MPQTERGTCTVCGRNPQASKGKDKKGRRIYKKQCSWCSSKLYRKAHAYKKHKKDSCELCGFLPTHSCQLDVDHIDGQHSNDEISNLQTLCANCHRLKTHLSGDYCR